MKEFPIAIRPVPWSSRRVRLLGQLGIAAMFSMPAFAATLPVRLLSVSVQFETVDTTVDSEPYFFGVGSTPFDINLPNGELVPVDTPVSGAAIRLGNLYTLRSRSQVYFDDFFLNTPDYLDANDDGIDDFFEPEMPITGSASQGYIEDGVDGAEFPLHATWYREAGASSGRCRVMLQNATLSRAIPFNVPYEILNFAGVFAATESKGAAAGTVFFRQSEHTTNTLLGNLQVTVTRPDQIQVSPGSLSPSQSGKTTFIPISELRRTGTNYVGLLNFPQGIPAAAEPRHRLWLLVISDPRDYNQDGVPDLSDPPPIVTTPPSLQIELRPMDLLLHLVGQTGGKYVLEQSATLSFSGGILATPLTLGDSTKTLSVPLPTERGSSYWRLRNVAN